MRCTPLLESQNLGKMSVPLKAHKREGERERSEERESKLKEILSCDKSQCDS